jgi:predicted enzyme related to lactoylglutathione lyase
VPYIEVPDVSKATERAEQLGSEVLIRPREGAQGWRSVISAPEGGDLAFWQPKRG